MIQKLSLSDYLECAEALKFKLIQPQYKSFIYLLDKKLFTAQCPMA